MEKLFDLCEVFVLDPMHDQQITHVNFSSGTLSLHFEDLRFNKLCSLEAQKYYDDHKNYRKCILTFSGLQEADLLAEVRRKKYTSIEVVEYYDEEFIEFLKSNHFCVEVSDLYCGYRTVIIQGAMVTQAGSYDVDCMIKISANTATYQWYT